SADFSYASTQIEQSAPAPAVRTRAPGPSRAVGASGSASQVQAATSTNLAKRDQFEQSIARAQASHSAFELS
ncbi:MAG: hypothetical protein JOZ05_02480, partial [Acetobacteraceae bacterium]|nr:hypothetical protein [Acetobacteraceae bacterium]